MRYLAIVLLLPWLLILAWAYWSYPKNLLRTPTRRAFDIAALLLAAFGAVQCANAAFDTASVPAVGQYGPQSGAIWQQVLPALCGYGACVLVLVLAMIVRQLVWRSHAR
ncbi:hypothetical protein DVT68_06850 [Dyella solisilvae]|uniref:Uncharacterized protein n=1 Tax=Dyella solisilvae TaxID=1920168 RepID=A0A370KCX7_9GAMM|nr:hypothetical protein [Dyella solisilvae]RDJ00504.1 hypothetical protein DVT68_06850 [Dyella solisilvae]